MGDAATSIWVSTAGHWCYSARGCTDYAAAGWRNSEGTVAERYEKKERGRERERDRYVGFCIILMPRLVDTWYCARPRRSRLSRINEKRRPQHPVARLSNPSRDFLGYLSTRTLYLQMYTTSSPFDAQPGVQSGIRFGECVFPLCETAESFPEGSLSAEFSDGHCAGRCTLRKRRRERERERERERKSRIQGREIETQRTTGTEIENRFVLFRVSPEIYEHPEDRGFGRAGTEAMKHKATRTTVRHISIPRREQQRLFPGRSRRMDLSQPGTTRDSWYYYTHV
ncbi:hypothetical protein X777_05037 [Ooceraea biroi]|uniref:Uncharacterized protein n=1 Tax=Ooceraea biroi TaxID=2015173 RepID=A0A026WFB4_OOCBI|nr:hypothetical protein X777_05037 [Ooceraea biroi]